MRGLYFGETGQGCLLLSSSRAFETLFPQKGMGVRGGNRQGCRTVSHISLVSLGWYEAARCGAGDQSFREAACSRVGAGERKVSRSESLVENRTHGSGDGSMKSFTGLTCSHICLGDENQLHEGWDWFLCPNPTASFSFPAEIHWQWSVGFPSLGVLLAGSEGHC